MYGTHWHFVDNPPESYAPLGRPTFARIAQFILNNLTVFSPEDAEEILRETDLRLGDNRLLDMSRYTDSMICIMDDVILFRVGKVVRIMGFLLDDNVDVGTAYRLFSRTPGTYGYENLTRDRTESRLLDWHRSLNRSAVQYSKLYPFDGFKASTEKELRSRFLNNLDMQGTNIVYIDSDTCIEGAIDNLAYPYELARKMFPNQECPRDITLSKLLSKRTMLSTTLGQMLESIKGVMQVDIGCWGHTLYLCELKLPDFGRSVCCVLDMFPGKSCLSSTDSFTTAAERRTRLGRSMEDGSHTWINVLVVRMTDLENIGEFYVNAKWLQDPKLSLSTHCTFTGKEYAVLCIWDAPCRC
ncbi:hypothetical protein BDK51DRAFT_43445 [Blyttiomyces helicus]|uniref:Uncharacterized protein n=1 Tax=Blyttiomyces helicus TaxID=388810 RepID=A0A4P9WQH1_9FUNG|nr:hypothetical protein BDK51DRAFT_43445 [Blyttiomyces helicus]|eukprot:RKO94635.1 hypothetical protein BDK51DRAFT_43445 [Blyttiomyces helicus]